jgi:hypothetical protein
MMEHDFLLSQLPHQYFFYFVFNFLLVSLFNNVRRILIFQKPQVESNYLSSLARLASGSPLPH